MDKDNISKVDHLLVNTAYSGACTLQGIVGALHQNNPEDKALENLYDEIFEVTDHIWRLYKLLIITSQK